MNFRWNEWNPDHATKHGCSIAEVERVVENAKPPYPEQIGDGKWYVVGRGASDRLIEVIYVLDPPRVVYVVHARPLNDREKRRYRRRTR